MTGDERSGTGSGPPTGGSSLPISRSFVVQFTRDTTPSSRRFHGRIEHIESGRSQRFGSLEALVVFVEEMLGTDEQA